jgi:hypothetical protein
MNLQSFTLRDFSLRENRLADYPSSNENIISLTDIKRNIKKPLREDGN